MTLDKVLDRIDADLDASLERLFAFLRIPSISTDPAHAGDCRTAAAHLSADLASLGLSASLQETGGHPVVLARSAEEAGAKRVLFYGHYDVQPVDPVAQWDAPPFEPRIATLPDGRKAILGRGSSDDKGQVMTFVEACRAWIAVTGSLPVPVTLMIEGEEECGSKSLPKWLAANKASLAADVALVCDTSMWDAATPAVTTALRGLVYDEVTIQGPSRDLHSGLFGGPARNPIRVLTKILGSLWDDDGRITLPGFYDGIEDPPADVLAAWRKLDVTAENYLGPVGLGEPAGERGRSIVEQLFSRPACDINGIFGGYTGAGSKTVIPAEASAKISFRLVKGQDPDKVRDAFRARVRELLPADCRALFTDHTGAPAVGLAWDLPQLSAAQKALTAEWGREALLIGSGASIPIVADFKQTLGLDSLLIGFALADDRIHSPNEKYDLLSFHKGIRSWARILAALAG
ncbi:Acetylornithine deacetylase/Succinyl-diaminopimelate desuccinylase protein [Rhodovulum sp. PH10]|uniref:M20/M25/M40 family metallo-hydrolase n=1 Tax=Rhodovulum sp. PH10 TaxID=1187851 RepID=UPI00027C25A1|nr:M20/M25/M40 family metallo-hydrolase [Rhodovulum sp. PH10]EJW13698.1 Acetylornithine deacetylase/Succinyl-diaminopimelate desuccinylase protein [Rhodovulum sp. PH10]